MSNRTCKMRRLVFVFSIGPVKFDENFKGSM